MTTVFDHRRSAARLPRGWWDRQDRRDRLVRLWQRGATTREIAEALGVTATQVAIEARRLQQDGRLGRHPAGRQNGGRVTAAHGGTGARGWSDDGSWARYVHEVWDRMSAELAERGIRYEDVRLRPYGSGRVPLTTSTTA